MPSAVTRLNLVSFSFGVLKLSSLMGLFSALPLWRDLAAADLGPAAGAPAGAAPQAIYRLYHAYMTRYHPYVSRDCAGHHPVIHSQGNPRRAYSSRQRLVVGIVRAQDVAREASLLASRRGADLAGLVLREHGAHRSSAGPHVDPHLLLGPETCKGADAPQLRTACALQPRDAVAVQSTRVWCDSTQ